MTTIQFASLLGIVLGFVAGVFFCVGAAEMKASQIRELAATHWDANPNVTRFFVALKSDYLCGGLALCLAFVIQFVSAVPGELPSKVLFERPGSGAFAAFALAAAVGGLLWLYRHRVINRLNSELARVES